MMPGPKPPAGRGATVNPAGRFEPRRVDAYWDDLESAGFEDLRERPPTEVSIDSTRTILATNDSPDVPFELSINPYRGCEHGCSYCFARATHPYLGFSAGLDFETKILAKPEAPALLREALAKPEYRCRPIALGTNTDPYQPLERTMRITRGVLEVLAACEHPFGIVTKSALVLRDLDLIAPAGARGQASVILSITTLDAGLARRMEPRASSPARRLAALRALAEAGVPCGVLASPMIPGLNDHELERILETARAAGATIAGYLVLRLPHEVREVFTAWLAASEPTRAAKVVAAIRGVHGGRLNDPRFGSRSRGEGPYADLLARRFEVARARLGFTTERMALDASRFRPPAPDRAQGRLFA